MPDFVLVFTMNIAHDMLGRVFAAQYATDEQHQHLCQHKLHCPQNEVFEPY